MPLDLDYQDNDRFIHHYFKKIYDGKLKVGKLYKPSKWVGKVQRIPVIVIYTVNDDMIIVENTETCSKEIFGSEMISSIDMDGHSVSIPVNNIVKIDYSCVVFRLRLDDDMDPFRYDTYPYRGIHTIDILATKDSKIELTE